AGFRSFELKSIELLVRAVANGGRRTSSGYGLGTSASGGHGGATGNQQRPRRIGVRTSTAWRYSDQRTQLGDSRDARAGRGQRRQRRPERYPLRRAGLPGVPTAR